MSNEKTLRTLQRMIERMERTLQYCQNESFASFQSNLMLQEACVFNLLQIGELAGRLSAEYVAASTQNWRAIKNMRNMFAHDYGSMDVERIWDTVITDIPILIAACQKELGS